MLPGVVAVGAVTVSQLAGGVVVYRTLGLRDAPDGTEVTDTDCGCGRTPTGVLNEIWPEPTEYVWAANGVAPANNTATRYAITLLDETFCNRLIWVLSLQN
jgi:hypothetical protein